MKSLYDLHPDSEEWEDFVNYINNSYIVEEDTIRSLWHDYKKEMEEK